MNPQQKSQPKQKLQPKLKLNLRLVMSIKNRLILAFLAVLLLPTGALGYFSYQKAEKDITEQILRNTKQSVDSVNQQTTKLITTSLEDLNYLAQTVNSGMVNGEKSPELRRVLDPIKAVKKEYDHVQYATNDGKLLNSPQQTFAAGFDPRDRPWYKNALAKKGEALVSSPIISQDGKVIVVPSKATEDGSGVVSVVLSLTNLSQQVNAIKVGEQGYVTILDQGYKYLTHPALPIGTENTELVVAQMKEQAEGIVDYVSSEGKRKKAIFETNELTGWKIVGIMDLDEIAQASRGIFQTTLIIMVIAVLLGMLLVLGIIRSIHRPLNRLMTATEKIASGDLREEVAVTSNDELGMLSAAVNRMTVNLRHLIGQVGSNSELVASTSEELSASAEQTRNTADHIASAVQEIAAGAERQVSSATELTQAMDEVSQGMDKAAASIQSVSQLTVATNNKASNGNTVVIKTVEQMNLIQETVSHTAEAVNQLGDKINEIGNIVTLITEIAGQTNLLALNAAIEAARAGENGRGFAVVAGEVRKLAEQSGAAAGQIRELIQHVQAEAENAVRSMHNGTEVVKEGIGMVHLTGETFREIVASIEQVAAEGMEVASIVSQVNANAQSMVEKANDVAGIAEQSAGNTQSVAAATEQQSASMEEVFASAEALSKMAQELQDVIGKFKL